MDKVTLVKVQNEEFEIAKEIRRVCDENNISYFLIGGTLLGSVRHKGFIPWDDDMDIGMLREEYEKFDAIANEKLRPEYCWQTWKNDKNYPLPFGKVRKRGTRYIEGKAKPLKENGFFVDVFPYDFAPDSEEVKIEIREKQKKIARILLMKSGYRPWCEDGKLLWKKRVGYIPYQLLSLFSSHENLVEEYEKIVTEIPIGNLLYEQAGSASTVYIETKYVSETRKGAFENEEFKIPIMTEKFLESFYGDYMQLPPIDERENRHQIIELDFGNCD